MHLKKSIGTLLAAVGLMAFVAAPVVTAEDPPVESDTANNSATITVKVESVGVFDVRFATGDQSFGNVSLSATSPVADRSNEIAIGYTDTKAYRPGFNVEIMIDDFSDGNGNVIPAENMTVTSTFQIQQQLWGGPGECDIDGSPGTVDPEKVADGCNPTVDVGDLGYFYNGLTIGTSFSTDWDPGYSLATWLPVHFGAAGSGTGNEPYGIVALNLHVPANTVAGDYSSTLKLNVVAGDEP